MITKTTIIKIAFITLVSIVACWFLYQKLIVVETEEEWKKHNVVLRYGGMLSTFIVLCGCAYIMVVGAFENDDTPTFIQDSAPISEPTVGTSYNLPPDDEIEKLSMELDKITRDNIR